MPILGTPMQSTPLERRRRFIENWEPSFGAAAEAAFDETRQLFGLKPLSDLQELANIKGFTGPTAIYDMYSDDPFFEKQTPSSRLLEPDEANEQYGIEGSLKFTEPVLEDEAMFRKKLKDEELQRAFTLEKNKGFLNNLGTFGVELIADITDPIGFMSLFFPVSKLRTITSLTKKYGKATPYVVGGLEAAGSAVIPMTPGYFASKEFDYSFTPGDYGVSLAGAAVLGGGLRKLFFSREIKDSQQFLEEIDDLNKKAGQDSKFQQQRSEDTVAGSASSKAEAETTPAGRAESRKHSVNDEAYEVKNKERIRAIHDVIKNSDQYKQDIQAGETNLTNARVTLSEIDSYLKEVNDLIKAETNTKVRLSLITARDTLNDYKKVAESVVNRLQQEAESNVVEKALTDRDVEVSPLDEGTIDFNLNKLNSQAKQAKLKNQKGGKKAAKQPRKAMSNALAILFPDVWKKFGKATKTRVLDDLVDKEDITLEDIIASLKKNTEGNKKDLDILKEKLLKSNEQELKGTDYSDPDAMNRAELEQQADNDALLDEQADIEGFEKSNQDLIAAIEEDPRYRTEEGELLPEVQTVIDDYNAEKIEPGRLYPKLTDVIECMKGR